MSQTSEQLNSRLEANRAEVVPNADGVKSGSSQTDCESQASIEELMKHAGLEPSLENATAIYALTDVPNYLLQGLNFEGRPVYRFAKRTFDVAASAVGMCLLSWLILGTAIAVKATSPGPIIFKQQRVGKNKKLFNIYKFRTMRIDTPNLPSHMIDANDWLTPIGAIMRRFSMASVIIGTPGDGESTKSLSRSANSSLDLQLCECRPGLCSTCNSHYKPFEFLSLGIFGGVPSLSRNLVGCNGFNPSEESAIRFSFLGFGKDGACAAW